MSRLDDSLHRVLDVWETRDFGDGEIRDILDDLVCRRRENLPPFGDAVEAEPRNLSRRDDIDRHEMLRMRRAGVTYRRIAAHFRCSIGMAHKICNGATAFEPYVMRPGKMLDVAYKTSHEI